MTINETTQLLSRGAILKLLADMLKQAEEENRDLLEALRYCEAASNQPQFSKHAAAAIKRVEGIDPDYEKAEAQREAN